MEGKTADVANLSLKLLVHKKKKRVIFAEADSHFVDTLFSIMTLPLGTIVRILEKCRDEEVEALGSLRNLYHSLKDLSLNYFKDSYILAVHNTKEMLLNPKGSSYDHCQSLKLNIDDTAIPKDYVKNGVFIANVSTFIVTDDLHVKANTPGVGIQLLCDFGITDTSQLEEMAFDIGRDQFLLLLKGALIFKYPLTYMVFHEPCFIQNLVKTSLGTLCNEEAADSKKVTLKVTLRKSNSKFLFAVVEGDFVDFLCGFLEIPLGTVIGKLMNGNSSIESLDNLYASISTMNVGYIQSQRLKDILLQPSLAFDHVSQNEVFSLGVSMVQNRRRDVIYGPLVKAGAMFLLTDDLVLTPVSSISTIAELNRLEVPLNDIVEHEISIGFEEGVKLLKACLSSSSPLTDALLKGSS